ncbi:hypothetical protein CMI44_00570 [Candidatus Pacearchaeota archaeon]|nr:hypothetical protein [Candidatus Pacearchaeota archaeon]
MAQKINQILKEVLERIKPPKKDLNFIDKNLKNFLKKLNEKIKSSKINAEIFIGGSYAKKTLIKKGKYDIDIFLRFDKKYKNGELSKLTEKLLKKTAKFSRIHGSRDYFRVKISPLLFFEIVPVLKVNNPRNAKNITDLSFSHVRYVNKKMKSKKILEDIMIAKSFCYAKNCYGAESYINGFSGYGLELLVYHYNGFIEFVRRISKIKSKKEIIDIEKLYKNKSSILLDINESKLFSPIIFIDPTYKQRNVLAALSEETFREFQKECIKFLKSPSIDSFEPVKVNHEKIKEEAKKEGYEYVLLRADTKRQEGDIAGSKLFKFYKHLSSEIKKYFEIKNRYFEYSGKKFAEYVFVVKSKNEILIKGPFVDDETNKKLFIRKHKTTFVKGGKICTKKKINFSIRRFIEEWKKDNQKKIKEMGVSGLGLL